MSEIDIGPVLVGLERGIDEKRLRGRKIAELLEEVKETWLGEDREQRNSE